MLIFIKLPIEYSNKANSKVTTAAHRAPRILLAYLQVTRKTDGVESMPAAHRSHRLAQLIEHRGVGEALQTDAAPIILQKKHLWV